MAKVEVSATTRRKLERMPFDEIAAYVGAVYVARRKRHGMHPHSCACDGCITRKAVRAVRSLLPGAHLSS